MNSRSWTLGIVAPRADGWHLGARSWMPTADACEVRECSITNFPANTRSSPRKCPRIGAGVGLGLPLQYSREFSAGEFFTVENLARRPRRYVDEWTLI